MTIEEWAELNALRNALWGEHRAPVPDVKALRLSLPVVAGIEFEEAAQWMAAKAAHDLFAPGAADIAAAFRRRGELPSPTFDEAFELTFGQQAKLLRRDATLGDFAAVHPLVASWVRRSGVERLRMLPIHDPEYGELRRVELKKSWEAHVEAFADRVQVALALPPGDRERGLEKMDPLAALGIDRPAELEAGSA